jgi:hypothetical protein
VLVVAMFFATANGFTDSILGPRHPAAAAQSAYREAPKNAERVLVVGDSVGYFLAKAMQTLRRTPPIAVFNAAQQGCEFPPPAKRTRRHNAEGHVDVEKPFGCDPNWEGPVVQKFKPDVVIWMTSNPADSVYFDGKWIDTCSSAYARLYENSLKTAFKVMHWPKTKIVMTNEPYPRYLFADEDKPTDCENRDRASVAHELGVQMIDLKSYVCPNGSCPRTLHGVTVRVDGEHYEDAGGRLVGSWLLDQIR